jgi:hypothetical protein
VLLLLLVLQIQQQRSYQDQLLQGACACPL